MAAPTRGCRCRRQSLTERWRLPPPARLRAEYSYLTILLIPSPPPVRLRAGPLSHRLPLQGGVIESYWRRSAARAAGEG